MYKKLSKVWCIWYNTFSQKMMLRLNTYFTEIFWFHSKKTWDLNVGIFRITLKGNLLARSMNYQSDDRIFFSKVYDLYN